MKIKFKNETLLTAVTEWVQANEFSDSETRQETALALKGLKYGGEAVLDDAGKEALKYLLSEVSDFDGMLQDGGAACGSELNTILKKLKH